MDIKLDWIIGYELDQEYLELNKQTMNMILINSNLCIFSLFWLIFLKYMYRILFHRWICIDRLSNVIFNKDVEKTWLFA